MQVLLIKFIVPKHYALLNDDDQGIILDCNQRRFTFKIKTEEMAIFRSYTFISNSFNFDLTEETVNKIQDSFYLLCMEFDISILMNPDIVSTYITSNTVEELRKSRKRNVIQDFYGVKVVPSDTSVMGSIQFKLLGKSDIKVFENLLNKYVNSDFHDYDRILRALEIYNSANYLTVINHAGRFILYMAAIETLIKQNDASKEIVGFIEAVQKDLKKLKVDKKEKESVISSIGFLKKISIRRSGHQLINQLLNASDKYNGYSPIYFFDKAYDLRSRFVHDGITNSEFLNMKHNQLQQFTKDLIINYFTKICC